MDPVTHTLAGWSLGRAGLRHVSPLAVATLVIAANAPDVDALAYLEGEYVALAFRRGWTHGVLAWVVLPVLVWAAVLLFDRTLRRWRRPAADPVRAGPLLAVATLGVLTHPLLDWLNTYGIRLLMPFDDRWFYGDALFIVDPWLWLLLAGGLFVGSAPGRTRAVGWILFWAAAGALLWWTSPPVPAWGVVVWLGGGLGLLWMRRALRKRTRRLRVERDRARTPAALPGELAPPPAEGPSGWPPRVGLALATVYVGLMIFLSARTEARVTEALVESTGTAPREVLASPRPADPLRRQLVIASAGGYHYGEDRVARGFDIDPGFLRAAPEDEVPEGALRRPDVANYLEWARFPVVEVTAAPGGSLVRVGDARYPGSAGAGSLRGITVQLPEPERSSPSAPPSGATPPSGTPP